MTELLPIFIVGLIAGAPLLAGVLTSCFGHYFAPRHIHASACVGAALSLVGSAVAVGLLCGMDRLPDQPLVLYRWVTLSGDGAALSVALQLDALSALFLAVSGIATLLVLLHHGTTKTADDSARLRFFACASFLQFATVMLLLATDWLTFFCFWQLSAIAAWLIVRTTSDSATIDTASTRNFITLRTADAVMLFGLFLFWNEHVTFKFVAMMTTVDSLPNADGLMGASTWGIGLCLFLAAAARCSLFPLITGRPSACIGCHPTNVLIESALLMPVGVYLLARSLPLAASSPALQTLVICIGAASAVAGAISAAVQTEPRRRLSATATSLFGMAVLGLGTGTTLGSTAALLLVFVHILAMTGLWLSISAATSNPHAVHPATAPHARWAFAANALVLCSGIWGQHTILVSVAQMGRDATNPLLGQLVLVAYWCAMASLPCLSFAMTRGFAALQSQANTTNDHSSRTAVSRLLWIPPIAAATVPLLLFSLPGEDNATGMFRGAAGEEFGLASLLAVDIGLPLTLLGAVVAWLSRTPADAQPQRTGRVLNSLVRCAQSSYGLPFLWTAIVGRPLRGLAQLCRLVDTGLLDVGWKTLPGRLVAWPARLSDPLQTGQIQFYVLSVLLATALLLLVLTGLGG